MREIKFRAWDKKNKKMYEVSSLWGSGKFWEIEPQKHGAKITSRIFIDIELYPCNLMQFTGFKDKNGKEIYEGDIVEVAEDENLICEVIYDNERAGFILYFDLAPQDNLFEDSSTLEVIGNVFENKNLLK